MSAKTRRREEKQEEQKEEQNPSSAGPLLGSWSIHQRDGWQCGTVNQLFNQELLFPSRLRVFALIL
jgi:hypothetical protein